MLLIAGLGWFFDSLVIILFNVLVPQIKGSLHLGMAQVGLVASLFLVGYTLGTLGGGTVSDYLGRRRTLSWSIVFYSLTTALTATAGSLGSLGIWRSLTGLGGGMELPAAGTYVTEVYPGRTRGLGTGIMFSFYSLGAVAASLLAVPFAGFAGGWRFAFAACLVPGFLIWVARRRLTESPRFVRVAELSRRTQVRPRVSLQGALAPRYRRNFLWRALTWMGTEWAYWSYAVYFPLFLMRQGHLTPQGLLLPLSLVYLGGAALVVASGYLCDRWGRCRVGGGFAAAGVAAMFLLTGTADPVLRWLTAALVFGLFQGPWVAGLLTTTEGFPTAIRGSATSAALTVGRVAAMFAPAVTGFLAQTYSLQLAFRLGALSLLLPLVGFILVGETRGRSLSDVALTGWWPRAWEAFDHGTGWPAWAGELAARAADGGLSCDGTREAFVAA